VIAGLDVPAEFRGPATAQIPDGPPLLGRQHRCELRDERGTAIPQDIRDLHGGAFVHDNLRTTYSRGPVGQPLKRALRGGQMLLPDVV
jgi:hypothetical protein